MVSGFKFLFNPRFPNFTHLSNLYELNHFEMIAIIPNLIFICFTIIMIKLIMEYPINPSVAHPHLSYSIFILNIIIYQIQFLVHHYHMAILNQCFFIINFILNLLYHLHYNFINY